MQQGNMPWIAAAAVLLTADTDHVQDLLVGLQTYSSKRHRYEAIGCTRC